MPNTLINRHPITASAMSVYPDIMKSISWPVLCPCIPGISATSESIKTVNSQQENLRQAELFSFLTNENFTNFKEYIPNHSFRVNIYYPIYSYPQQVASGAQSLSTTAAHHNDQESYLLYYALTCLNTVSVVLLVLNQVLQEQNPSF